MISLTRQLRASPIHARGVPYLVLVLLAFAGPKFHEPVRSWFYLAEMLAGAYCIWAVRDIVTEARWVFSWEGLAAGVLVFVLWVGLDPFYPKISPGAAWNPFSIFGQGTAMAWFFIAVRTIGSAVVVPPIEEAFFRSFLYRWLVRTSFTEMPLSQFHWLSMLVTSAFFGLLHPQWLPGVLCGLTWQALVIWKGRLGDAMFAHAVTNFLLGPWAVWKNDWHFWT